MYRHSHVLFVFQKCVICIFSFSYFHMFTYIYIYVIYIIYMIYIYMYRHSHALFVFQKCINTFRQQISHVLFVAKKLMKCVDTFLKYK